MPIQLKWRYIVHVNYYHGHAIHSVKLLVCRGGDMSHTDSQSFNKGTRPAALPPHDTARNCILYHTSAAPND